MRPSALAIATIFAVLAATAPAAAGITAVFGGLRPAVSSADAVCTAPAGGLLRLEPIAGLAVSPLR
ncbi:hypothetical protein [Pinisolibacter sp.]|uniref:hypothetical protein n=1 Tax=Pinisolibacter sp. TaxID=2172024 RepID=UPI002FDDDF08